MKITEQTKYTLDADEIKVAIRKHLIDKLGTTPNINESDIVIDCSVDRDINTYDFIAVATVTKETDTNKIILDAELLRLIKAGTKLQAVKLKKESSGMGLKDAKDYVDNLASQYANSQD